MLQSFATEDYPAILQSLELAVKNYEKLKNSLSLIELDSYRNSKDCIFAGKYIMERSKDTQVLFHCITSLRAGILRDWHTLPRDLINYIRSFLLNYLATNYNKIKYITPAINSQIQLTISSIVKRGWLVQIDSLPQDTEECKVQKQLFFQEVTSLLQNPDLQLKEIAIKLCQELIVEFNTDSRERIAALNIPYFIHTCAKQAFQENELKEIFMMTVKMLSEIIQGDINPLLTPFLLSCFQLNFSILNWPFVATEGGNQSVDADSDLSTINFQPGVTWAPIFLQESNFFVLELYFKYWYYFRNNDAEIVEVLNESLSVLSSLRGEIFQNQPQQQFSYMYYIGSHLIKIIAEAQSSREISTMCEMISQLTTSFPLEYFTKWPEDQNFFASLMKITTNLLEAISTSTGSVDDRENMLVAFDSMLESWVLFVGDPLSSNQPLLTLEMLHICGKTIFELYVSSRMNLVDMKLSDFDDADVLNKINDCGNYLEELESVAHLARLCPPDAASVLNESIKLRVKVVFDSFLLNPSEMAPQVLLALKQLEWLIAMSGHFLCDDPSDECVTVPPLINNYLSTHQTPNDPIIGLCHTMIQLIDCENSYYMNGKARLWLPAVANRVCWFFNRWCQAYVLVSKDDSRFDHVCPKIIEAFGLASSEGIISSLLTKVTVNLMSQQPVIFDNTCDLLLGVSTLKVQAHQIFALDAWKKLLPLYLSSSQDTLSLKIPPKIYLKFIRGVFAMNKYSDASQQQHYFTELAAPVLEQFKQVLSSTAFEQNMQDPLMIEIVKNLLDKTHGVILSCNQYNSAYVWGFCLELMNKIYIELFKIYKQPDVVQKILQIWVTISRIVLDRLPDEHKTTFFASSSELFEAFKNAGYGNKLTKRMKKKDDEENQYKNVSKILKIVTDISQQRHQESAMRAFHGTSVIINAMTKELLAIPKMATDCYSATLSILTCHSVLLPAISEDLFKKFIELLSMPLKLNNNFAPEVVEKILLGTVNMFTCYFYSVPNGKNIFGKGVEVIKSFIDVLLDFLLFGDIFHPKIEQIAADAYYLVMIYDQKRYGQKVQQLVGHQDPLSQHLIINYFNNLKNNLNDDDILMEGVLEGNKKEFRNNFQVFLACSRGILKRKL
jgi:hypothetical protein